MEICYRQKTFERSAGTRPYLTDMLFLLAAFSQQSQKRDVPGAVEQSGVH